MLSLLPNHKQICYKSVRSVGRHNNFCAITITLVHHFDMRGEKEGGEGLQDYKFRIFF